MKSSIIVTENCMVRMTGAFDRAFDSGEVVEYGSIFYYPLLWSGLATETGVASLVQPEMPPEIVAVDRNDVENSDMIRWDESLDRWVITDFDLSVTNMIQTAISKLSGTLPDEVESVEDVYERLVTAESNIAGLSNSKAPVSHQHPFNQISGVAGSGQLASGTATNGYVVKSVDGAPTWQPDLDTTYSIMTSAEAEAGSSVVARVVSAQSLKAYLDYRMNQLVNGAPTTLDTLSEISEALAAGDNAGTAILNALNAHTARTDNPHATTKAQVGLSLVPNVDTTDAGNLSKGTLLDARLPARMGATAKLITDWNTANQGGAYMADAGANAPTPTGWYIGQVYSHTSQYLIQTVTAFTTVTAGDSLTYRRTCIAGNWSAWEKQLGNITELDNRYSRKITSTGTMESTGRIYRDVLNFKTGSATPGMRLIVRTAIPFTTSMARIHFEGYVYGSNGSTIDLDVNLYAYQETGLAPVVPHSSWNNNGTCPIVAVYVCRDSANRVVLVIDSQAQMEYAHVTVPFILLGHNNIQDSMAQGWSAAMSTDLTGLTTIQTVPRRYAPVDPAALARANHTGTQLAATVTDLAEAIDDRVAQLLAGGGGISINYDDANNKITLTAVEGGSTDTEAIRDTIGVALVGMGLVSVVANDTADTITITTTATANSSDAFLLNRANHTGPQPDAYDVTNLSQYVQEEGTTLFVTRLEVGAPFGVPTLNAAGRIPSQQINGVAALANLGAQEKVAYLGASGYQTVDASLASVFVTSPLTGAITFSWANLPNDGNLATFTIFVRQGSSPKGVEPSASGTWRWLGAQPVGVANKTTVYTLATYDAGVNWWISGVVEA